MEKSYDRIIKETLKGVVDVLITKVLGIEVKSNTMLETKLQITDEREADFILQIEPMKGDDFIIHLEFQSTNDTNMIYRMLRYYLYVTETYKLPVKQYVIYIGRGKLRMRSEIKTDRLIFTYELIDMREISCDSFLESENPEEIILSILCDFGSKGDRVVIREILGKLKERVKEETVFSKYIRQLEILSQLRDLQETISEEESKMAIIYNLEEDIRFKQGKAEGEAEGEAKGKAEGEAKGKAEGEAKGKAEGEAKGKAEGEAKGKAEGEAKGKAEGEAKGKLEIAKNMIQQGVELKLIAKYTGLLEKEIRQIKEG